MNKKKVLIIDDEEFITDLIKDILTLENISCASAEDFDKGFELFEKEHFDLILADKNIENFKIEDFIRKKNSLKMNVPVILMTGERGIEDEELSEMGIDKVMYKPFKMDYFLLIVKEMMEIK